MPSSSPAPASDNLLTDLDFNFLINPVIEAMPAAHAIETLAPIASMRKLKMQVADLSLEICAREALQVRDRESRRILCLAIEALKNK
jgi:hypothetical protein